MFHGVDNIFHNVDNENNASFPFTERTIDLLFGSRFVKESEVNKSQHHYAKNGYFTMKPFKEKHRNAFVNVSLDQLQLLKKNQYEIDSFVPESVL